MSNYIAQCTTWVPSFMPSAILVPPGYMLVRFNPPLARITYRVPAPAPTPAPVPAVPAIHPALARPPFQWDVRATAFPPTLTRDQPFLDEPAFSSHPTSITLRFVTSQGVAFTHAIAGADEGGRNLAQTVKDIREGFRAVADDLIGFENDEYKDKDGEVLRLRPQWLGYQTAFDDLLERSHRNALAASSMIRQYTEAILTDVDPSEFEDLREELQGFLRKLEEKAPTAQQTQGDLQTLADDVRSFKAVIDETLGKAEVKCVSDINEAKDHLDDLGKKLESINDEKTKLGVVAVGGLLLGGACAVIAMFVLVPSAGRVVMDALADMGVVGAGYCGIRGWLLHQQGNKCETEMEECRIDIVHKRERHRELLGHETAL